MNFAVWIVAAEADHHWQALREGAAGIADSLKRLGHDVIFAPGAGRDVVTGGGEIKSNRRLIVFNAHRLPDDTILSKNAIIFNAEQVQVDMWQNSVYAARLRRHAVWDYSEVNLERLKTLGVEHVALCRIGYWAGLSSIAPADHEDLDVLFFGSVNDRRKRALEDIARHRIRVHTLFGVYGEERDRCIARAKIVLNVHFYPNPIWEIFRCSFLLANRKCVVSEDGGYDPTLENFAAKSTVLVSYEQIGNTVVNLLKDDNLRRQVATRGFKAFERIDQVEEVRAALEATS